MKNLFAALFSWMLNFDGTLESYNEIKTGIEESYGITFHIRQSDYQAFSDAEKARYDEAYEALNSNQEAVRLYARLNILALLIISIPVLISYLILDFMIPMLLKHGRTLGKRIFGLCLIRPNCVKLTGPVLFIRTVIGKCMIETLIPVLIVIMFIFGKGNIFLLALLVLIPIVNLILFFATKNHTVLHDLLAVTVAADYDSQRIFDTEDDLIEFKRKKHEDEVQNLREREYSHI